MVINKKLLILAAASVVLLGGLVLAVAKHDNKPVDNPPQSPTSPINYGPPTQAEKDQAQARKEEIAAQNNTPVETGKKRVTPVITNASQSGQQVTVNAYTSGVVENGGICTATFVKDNLKITKTSEAFANASTTNCTPIKADRVEFASAGDWQVDVAYSSSAASGVSPVQTLKLQ